MHTPSLRTGMILVALAAASWGTVGIAVDLLYRMTTTDPVSIGFWRTALSVLLLLVISRIYAGTGFWRFERRDVKPLLLMGAAFAAYQVLYFAAIPRIGVAAAVLINICSAPVIIALLSAAFLRERLTRVIGLALVGAVVGVGLLVGGSPEAASRSELIVGAGLALGAGVSYSLVALAARVLAPRYPPVQPIAIAFTLGTIMLLPFALAQGLDVGYDWQGWLLLLHLGIVPTGIGYWLYLRGLKATPVTIAGIVALMEPLVSAALAVAFLGERLSPAGALGGALLLGSMVFLYVSQSRR